MGRQGAEESLNSFNAAPPLSDARLGHLGRGGFQSAGSERSHIPENGLGSGPRGPFPPKSSIAIIPEIAQSWRILAAIWETVALFGWLATLPSTLFSFVHASLRPFYHLCSSSLPAIPAYLVSLA